MKRTASVAAIVAVAGVSMCGCGAKEAKWSGNAAAMVVYAKSIPLYPGAKAKDAMGSDSYGDTPDSHSEGMAVWFEVKDYDREKVVAWYKERLPNATQRSQTAQSAAGSPWPLSGLANRGQRAAANEHARPWTGRSRCLCGGAVGPTACARESGRRGACRRSPHPTLLPAGTSRVLGFTGRLGAPAAWWMTGSRAGFHARGCKERSLGSPQDASRHNRL